MQLPRGRRRQITQSSRLEGPLVYARLSDPILVKRAKDGDARALEALCERHAPRVEKLAGHLLRDPEDAHDVAGSAGEALRQDQAVPGRVAVRDLAAPVDDQRLSRRGKPATGPSLRAAARGSASSHRCGSGARGRPGGAARRAEPLSGRDRARTGPRRRPEGRAGLLVRGDLGRRRHARRNGEVLRAPRPQPVARQALGRRMTFPRLRLARVRETMFPSRAPFFRDRLPTHGPEDGP